jgi:putative two-component system response regulator
MQILIVDDDETTLAVLKGILSTAGYGVSVARDGHAALQQLHEDGTARLIISDWVMPGMDGLELCRRVRQGGFPGYIYFILLTGHTRTQDIVAGLSAGADDFITKPFEPAELLVRVRAGERIIGLETRHLALFLLAKLVESRDPEIGTHLERMRNYARCLAEQLAHQSKYADLIDDAYVDLIYQTSPLHDIGKVGLPDHILRKPSRLSPAEREQMKAHTTLGASTLDAALQQYPGVPFLQMARDIALTHHERFDGGGYPAHLIGERIPLPGRIVALADVYDALTSKRAYKGAFSHEVARTVIIDEAGGHFDPDVVDAFVATEDRFRAIQHAWTSDRSSQDGIASSGIGPGTRSHSQERDRDGSVFKFELVGA